LIKLHAKIRNPTVRLGGNKEENGILQRSAKFSFHNKKGPILMNRAFYTFREK